MKHYTKEELDCYRHHEMSVLGRINCAAHLKECDECANLLVELEQDDVFVGELRDSIRKYQEARQKVFRHPTTK
ncbi:MAG: hypothetical protein J6866_06020 [Victivallales bacterium]|jgi:hypothetical protein|nr:hypothetical protein [Victivallales bacterium]